MSCTLLAKVLGFLTILDMQIVEAFCLRVNYLVLQYIFFFNLMFFFQSNVIESKIFNKKSYQIAINMHGHLGTIQ